MERILITGGAGFIGSHTCLYLLQKGYDLFIIDSFINSSPISLNRVCKLNNCSKQKKDNLLKVFEGDLRDMVFIESIFKLAEDEDKPISGVIHFAGLKSVKDSVHNPMDYWDFNVSGTISLLKVMKKFNCFTIVFSSSATVYGNNKNFLINEKSHLKPTNPYGKTKLVIENILGTLFSSDKKRWKISILRYFNPVGAHFSGLIGENPKGTPNNLFPIITQVALRKLKKLEIYGDDYETSDGTCERDYIHVMDLANGHVKALEFLKNEPPSIHHINLGTGIGTSVIKIVNVFQKVNKIEIPYKIVNRRDGDVSRLVADNSLAISILNWKPDKNIENMCKDSWKWQKLNPRGYQ